MIGGLYSVAELRDWIAAIDVEVAVVEKGRGETLPAWAARDAAAAARWASEWKAFRDRWDRARLVAVTEIEVARFDYTRPDSLIVAFAWPVVARALRTVAGVESPGDFQELYRRLALARGGNLDFSRVPQPGTGNDFELVIFKAADGTIRAGEQGARDAAAALSPWLLVAGLVLVASLVLRR
jgi:hypothetical protein